MLKLNLRQALHTRERRGSRISYMLKEAREILDKQSLMGSWEKVTDESLTPETWR